MQTAPRGMAGLLAVLMLGAWLGVTGIACGQFGEAAGFGEIMSPYYQRRDLVHFVEGLGLDDGQSVILESMFWDYEDAQYDARDRMMQVIVEMRPELEKLDKGQIMRLIFEPFEDRSAEYDYMNDQFLESVRAILNERQLGNWDAFARTIRREKELDPRRCRLSGEGINLFHILNEINVGERDRASIQGLLDEYATQMEGKLRSRQELLRQNRIPMIHAIRDGEIDVPMQIYQRELSARVDVRDINDHFAVAIAEALPAQLGEEMLQIARERAYPRVFRPTPAQRIFSAAKELENLDRQTMEGVLNLEAAYLVELTVINDRIFRLLREFEPQDELYRATAFSLRRTGQQPERPEDPTRPEFRQRDELDRHYMEQLSELLTAEVFGTLPGAQRFIRRQAPSVEDMGGSTSGGKESVRGGITPMKRKGPKGKGKGGNEEDGKE